LNNNNVNINIDIYNLWGQKVISLNNIKQLAGKNSITWNLKDANGANVANGLYVVQINCSGDIISKKILVVK
jgi:flagellar hook assembly protein FlgD